MRRRSASLWPPPTAFSQKSSRRPSSGAIAHLPREASVELPAAGVGLNAREIVTTAPPSVRTTERYRTASSLSRKALKLGMSIRRWSILPFVTNSHNPSLVGRSTRAATSNSRFSECGKWGLLDRSSSAAQLLVRMIPQRAPTATPRTLASESLERPWRILPPGTHPEPTSASPAKFHAPPSQCPRPGTALPRHHPSARLRVLWRCEPEPAHC